MSTMHPTAYLEYYADRYAANLLHKHGVTLDQYLADPTRYDYLVDVPFPLLKAQTRFQIQEAHEELLRQEAMAGELEDLPRNNVRPFEPLRHNRFPKRRGIACRFRRKPNPQTT